MTNYFLAIATLIGTIIGVGIFTLPFIIDQSGIIFLPIYLIVLGFIQYYLYLLFAEIILSTNNSHRLTGYVAKYSNKKTKYLTLLITTFSAYGAIIAYIIVGGLFLHQLLNPLFGQSVFFYTLILFTLESFIVLIGLKLIAKIELILTFLMIVAVGMIVWRGWDYFTFANFNIIQLQNAFLPYGPIFFAISGAVAIPGVCKLLAKNKEKIKNAIFWGNFIPLLMIFVFVITIIGISGNHITPDVLSGLGLIFQNGIMMFTLIFSLLAIITSFLTISQDLRESFWWDFKVDKTVAWVLACIVPYLLYLFGLNNLIKIVSITGALGGSAFGIILLWLIFQVKKRPDKESIINNKLNKPIVYFLSLLFILGFIYELTTIFK
ncbi:MAG: aromatic amino acid transport family protein [Patescibacteria group bacterium]|nr:hypothetical protein [Patescibacteria group bacterium]MBU1870533.1 hypothetical protein [Patescibacteria group bacterium]